MLLAEAMTGKRNNFDLIRLGAALLVLFSHSFPLLGRADEPLRSFTGYDTFGTLAVEIFFIISGMLITKSWMDSPRIGGFLRKRVLRIFPAFAVVTLLSVFVLGPLFTKLPLREYFGSKATWTYLGNPFMLPTQYALPGVFETNPYPTAVNGSIWSLPLEILMYAAVLALGLLQAFKKRISVIGLACLLFLAEFRLPIQTLFPSGLILNFPASSFFQCSMFFCLGALTWLYREKIRISHAAAGLSLFLYLASSGTPFFHLLSYPTVTYLVVWMAFLPLPRWLDTRKYGDFSYGIYLYAFPVQQSVMAVFGGGMPFPAFFTLSLTGTVALAMLSWRFIEKPAMKYKRGISRTVAAVKTDPKRKVAI